MWESLGKLHAWLCVQSLSWHTGSIVHAATCKCSGVNSFINVEILYFNVAIENVY